MKNRLFQFCLYFAIFSTILSQFEVQNISDDREFLFYKTGLFYEFLNAIFYEKGIKPEKIRIKFRSSIFSIMDKTIDKVRAISLYFLYVVALITTHHLVYFPLSNFTRRL